MANPMKGEIAFDAGGDTYTMAFTINALVTLEDKLQVTTSQIGELLGEKLSMANLRTLFWAGLLEHHDCSEIEAGRLISDLGIQQAAELMGRALSKAFPEAGKSNARPQKAAAGTGKAS
ncbi:hypothetical protein [Brevundimonas sp.]|uniref:hypothetical protein n=1 Tax=Brevundimonas sp. TaxID=1871086 RepID=UPI0025BFDBD9|nr:hypothetical protein [Brevundimonas sp.]